MPEPQLCNPRKRQRSEQRPLQLNGASQPLSKRQKLSYPITRSSPSAAFWDNLSKIELTKRALRELDRRNALSALSPRRPSNRRPHRPLTRYALAELKKNRQPSQSAPEYLCSCAPRRLKDIKLFTRHGGPNLTDLRRYPEPVNPLNHTMSSSQSRSRGRKRDSTSTPNTRATTKTTTTKSTGPYDRGFQQNLIDGGVYPHAYEYPDGRIPAKPNNWKQINQRLGQPRPSLSPSRFSDKEFKEFIRADAHAFKEKQVTNSVIPIIEGKVGYGRCVAGDIPFNNLDPLTDGTITPGKPDLFYGARPEQLDQVVRIELSSRIIPSTQDDLPMAPNFFLEAKGPDGNAVVARRQACYDGALGARGMHSLQSYGQDAVVYDNNAYTITSIYNDGTLKLYTSHLTQPIEPEGQPEYYMNQLKAWAVTSDVETFRQGATAYRNSKDWAKEKRDEFIDAANGRATDLYIASASFESSLDAEVSTSTTRHEVAESETSADELALDDEEMSTSVSKRARIEHPDPNERTGRRGCHPRNQ